MMSRTGTFETLSWVFDCRARSLELLEKIRSGETPVEALREVVAALQRGAETLGSSASGRSYGQYATILGLVHLLTQWAHAVRQAEPDAARYRNAARQRARDFVRGDDGGHLAVFNVIAERIESVGEVEAIAGLAADLMGIPLPVPLSGIQEVAIVASEAVKTASPRAAVAVATFRIGREPFGDPQTIEPNRLYEIEGEFAVSEWPVQAARVVFEPMHVEPSDRLAPPRFEFARPEGDPPYRLRDTKRMSIAVHQDIDARPLRVAYRGRWEPTEAGDVIVRGHRELALMSYDPQLDPISGFRLGDEALMSVREQIRRLGFVSDTELGHFLTAMGGLTNIAGQALASNLFAGKWQERQFQGKVREILRSMPRIGAGLEEHPHAGGGETDLSFKGVRIELKVENEEAVTEESVARYLGQTKQYASGSDARIAILCVLDCSVKKSAPDSLDNDITLHRVVAHEGVRPTLVGVVVVRGNLSLPSGLP